MYWDRTHRRISTAITEVLNTYDIEFQHRLPIGERNNLIWGGYRLMQDEVDNTAAIAFRPARRDQDGDDLFFPYGVDEAGFFQLLNEA